ncbi:MAG: hypothetical protein RLN63_10160, partial [Miltoncostaeaceae bacterium]
PWGLAWTAATPAVMRRASCALAHRGQVWLIDPVDGPGLADALAPLGEVAGVVRLLDRHPRDCAALAERHGVPLHENPVGGVPGAPFQSIPLVQGRLWREVALWWGEHRLMVVPESVGTAPYFLSPGLPLGIHPFMRLSPPRALLAHRPQTLVVGHGEPVEDGSVADDLHRAVTRARRDIPGWLASLPRRRRAS